MQPNLKKQHDHWTRRNLARRNMPSWRSVAKYWSDLFFDHGWEIDFEILYKKQCFACGKKGKIQRCHIKPKCEGGNDYVKNIHLLCVSCHEESEFLSGLSYWRWYRHKRYVEFSDILKKEMDMLKLKYRHVLKQNNAESSYGRGGASDAN